MRRTTGRAHRSATASTSRSTAASVHAPGAEGHAVDRAHLIDPKDSNVVYVAAVGRLFGPNAERGVYKTIDGGKTWTADKVIDADTGFTDIVIDPFDSKILYAASHQRRRVPWGFNGGGPGNGLWKSADAGRTWARITGNGFP